MHTPSEPVRLPSHVLSPVGVASQTAVSAARTRLDQFVLNQSHATARDVGFAWRGTLDAPVSADDRCAAFARSLVTGEPLPVSSAHLDGSLHRDPHAALAARFWREVSRQRRCASDDPIAEIELGLWQVAVAESGGLSRLSVALFEASLTGQALLRALTGRDAPDELRLAIDVLTYGLADAIVLEAERRAEAPTAPLGR